MLPLVVGGAASIPAVAFHHELPGLQAGTPLSLLSVDHVPMAVGQHARQALSLDATRHHQRRRTGHRVVEHLAIKTTGREFWRDFLHQIRLEYLVVTRLVTGRGLRHTPLEQGLVMAVIEPAAAVRQDLRSCHVVSIGKG